MQQYAFGNSTTKTLVDAQNMGHNRPHAVGFPIREAFSLDISRRRIALTTKYQTRGRHSVVLARLDFNSPHRNPDDTEVGIPHLHLYREGFGDKWAYDVPAEMLKNPADPWQVLLDFMSYCRVVEPPNISRGLFS